MIWIHDFATRLTKRWGQLIHIFAIFSVTVLTFFRILEFASPHNFPPSSPPLPYLAASFLYAAAYIYFGVYIALGTVILMTRFFRWLNKKYPFLPFPE